MKQGVFVLIVLIGIVLAACGNTPNQPSQNRSAGNQSSGPSPTKSTAQALQAQAESESQRKAIIESANATAAAIVAAARSAPDTAVTSIPTEAALPTATTARATATPLPTATTAPTATSEPTPTPRPKATKTPTPEAKLTLYVDAADAGYKGVNLRAKPSKDSKSMGLLPNGESVTAMGTPVKGDDGKDWYWVVNKGNKGYMLGSLLSLNKPTRTVPASDEDAEVGNQGSDSDEDAASNARTFGDGIHEVGVDIQPGTYRAREAQSGCYWARLSSLSGETDDIIANENEEAHPVVTISPIDKAFESDGCGEWTTDLSAVTDSRTSFGDGKFIIGTDIDPGTYRSEVGSGCYYARLSGFGGTTDEIIANANASGPALVTIAPTDKGFQSSGCGKWTRR